MAAQKFLNTPIFPLNPYFPNPLFLNQENETALGDLGGSIAISKTKFDNLFIIRKKYGS